ncbi:hypothetical protein M3Y94_00012100 [Aphelenchoides besseyi]|nr:hypothetical protein M3Y94_00012100 [Aphelenchoides besseyi]KAI6216821.1 hypothetical protein M3Y95_01254800 [Aphelenchoides besseyi]
MLRFVFLSILVVQLVDSYDTSECIKKVDFNEGDKSSRFYVFKNCESDAEIWLKWKAGNSLLMSPERLGLGDHGLTVTLNENCMLVFEAKNEEEQEQIKWNDQHENFANCTELSDCSLVLRNDSKLFTDNGQELCLNTILRNTIDDQWVWTKIRVQGLQPNDTFVVGRTNFEDGEVEKLPPNSAFSTYDRSIGLLLIFITTILCF